MASVSAVIILLFVAAQFASAYRQNYNYGYNNYNNYNYRNYNNGYGNYNNYNNYNPYRNYNNNGYGNYNYYNNGYGAYSGHGNGYSNYNYSPFGGTTAGGTYVGSPLARIWLTCNGIGCPARG